MSPARCSSCHCYSRSCPVGLPNHRTVSNVGSQCTMNPAGRHYRDQADTSIPTCDYENCNFFSTSEFSSLPYPTDVALGPVSENPQSSQQSADLSLILQLLQQQKEESEKTNNEIRQTNSNMAALQHQVNSLIPSSSPPGPVLSTPVTTRTTTVQSMTFTAPTFTSTTTAPNVVTSAAAGLTAALQGGLGHLNNYGYSGLTMDQLRANPGIVSQAAATLTAATNDVPPLNPLHGMGLALGQPTQPDQVTLQHLVRGAESTMSQYYAKKSRDNVLSHLKQLSIFCVAFQEPFLPVSRNAPLGFVELMSRTCGFDHIQHILSSVKFLHEFTGHKYQGDSFEF